MGEQRLAGIRRKWQRGFGRSTRHRGFAEFRINAVGDALGIPAWVIAAIALFGLCVYSRRVPWRDVPLPAIALALALGTLALGAASALHVERVLSVSGVSSVER